jgi:exopolysaccharide production protein ExoQ
MTIVYLVVVSMAITVAFACVFGLWFTNYCVVRRGARPTSIVLLWLLGLGSIAFGVLLPRANEAEGTFDVIRLFPKAEFLALWLGRCVSYGSLGLSLLVVATSIFSREQRSERRGLPLLLGFLAMVVGPFMSTVGGTEAGFKQFLIYGPVVFSAGYLLQTDDDPQWIVRHLKAILLVYLYGSVAAVVLAPAWALTQGAPPIIPGFTTRVHGIATHSNGLGVIALTFLLLERSFPAGRSWGKLNAVVALGLLVAAQSKTVWMASLLILLYLGFSSISRATSVSVTTHGRVPVALVCGIAALFVACCVVILEPPFVARIVQRLHADGVTESYGTLTGRTQIWAITLDSWRDNPVFGYGPDLWSVDYRLKYAPQMVSTTGMAHNQFIQALGESGVIGLAGLLAYCVVLIVYSIRSSNRWKGLSVCVLIMLLTRMVTEAPLRNYSIDAQFFLHFSLFMLFVLFERARVPTRVLTGSAVATT